jgi:hypothetical protein
MVGKTEPDTIETIKETVLEDIKGTYKKKIRDNEIEVLAARPFRDWIVIGVKVSLVKTQLRKVLPLIFSDLNKTRAVKNCEVAGMYTVLLYKSTAAIPRVNEVNRLMESYYAQYGTNIFANIVLKYKTESDNVLVRFGAEDAVFYGINISLDNKQTETGLKRDIEGSLSDIFLYYTMVKRLFKKYETERKLFYESLTEASASAQREVQGCTKSCIEELIQRAQRIGIEDTEKIENYLTDMMKFLMMLDSKRTYLKGIQNEIDDNIANLEFSFSLLEPQKYLEFPSLHDDITRECELVRTGYKSFIADVTRYEDTLNNIVNLIRGRLETQYLKTQLLCSEESIKLTKASERSRQSIELLTLVFASLGLSQVFSVFLIFWLQSDKGSEATINVILYCFWSLAVPIFIVAVIYFLLRKRRRSPSE